MLGSAGFYSALADWRRGRPSRSPVIIDCDPGIDDAFALALAARSRELDVRLITTVAGNVSLELTTTNARALVAALNRDDIPVAAGADRGLVRVKPSHRLVHGAGGLGGVELRAVPVCARPQRAIDEIARVLEAAEPGSVTIVAIGPLTNVALLLALRPDLEGRVARIITMNGSSGPGNVTPAAEYNTWADPEAAQRVLTADVEIWLAELQVTRQATLDAESRARIGTGSRIGSLLTAMLGGYADESPGNVPALHDVVAVAALIDPGLVQTRAARVQVITDDGPRRGETVISCDEARTDGSSVRVAVALDVERLRRLLVSRLAD